MNEPRKKAKRMLVLLSALCLCSRINVFAHEKPSSPFPFYEDGDVVGVIGDSITHVQYGPISYVEALYGWYLGRFPERKIEFRNLGTAGYTVSDVLNIYDQDPAFQGINKAIIMLGMNEAFYEISAEEYMQGMEELINRLKADGLSGEDILVLSPTPYDDTCALNYDRRGNPYRLIDHFLVEFTEQLAQKTEEWGTQYMDLHTPLLALTKELQRENPKNTLTRGDCIHPSDIGQMLMSYYILQAQGAMELETGIFVPAKGEAQAAKGEITDFYRGESGSCWILKPGTLPAALTEELRKYLEFFPQAESLYQDRLQVEGLLSEASYKVYMGEAELGTYMGKELAGGVNLALLETHPLQEIAQELDGINRSLHQNLMGHRAMWIEIGQAGYTEEEIQAAYESWRADDVELREHMYALAQEAGQKVFSMAVVEEGHTIQELKQEREEAKRAAAEQIIKEVQKKIQRASDMQHEQKKQEISKIERFIILVILATAAMMLVILCLTMKKRSK